MSGKRTDYLSWDEYFMGVAVLSGMRSKDPNTQVGCCIVSQDNKILSMGYNGFPIGCSDDEFPWARDGEDPLETKYVYSTHSELNAILNYNGGSLAGAKLYVTLLSGEKYTYVSEFICKEEEPENDCAVSVYVPSAGDTLWETAKKLGKTPEQVQSANPGLSFPLSGGERILVYRKKENVV